ncbi:MAG TPA: hypothetical protein VMG60_08730 [Burkholderiaceae bacterium]|nr:hypothetical protein [Burkholderiaceae bacterium]
MAILTHYPILTFGVFFFGLVAAAWIGALVSRRRPVQDQMGREDFNLIISATLTLLGLIIGFSFAMAVSRYDQRKNYEEAEANAIGTEYVRADLLPAAEAAKMRALLLDYTDQRILFYSIPDEAQLQQVNARTAMLQGQLWSVVQNQAVAQPTPVNALVVAGMNDVLNSQGYTQAAFWNQIPQAAWALMAAIAIFSNVMVGIGATSSKAHPTLLWVLPLIVAVAFFLIADLDSPRRGVIHVTAQNLVSLAESLRPR